MWNCVDNISQNITSTGWNEDELFVQLRTKFGLREALKKHFFVTNVTHGGFGVDPGHESRESGPDWSSSLSSKRLKQWAFSKKIIKNWL